MTSKIISTTAAKFGVPPEFIAGKQRWQPLATARHVAIALTMERNPGMSLGECAKWFHKKDHSSIAHALRSFHNQLETSPQFRKIVEEVRGEI